MSLIRKPNFFQKRQSATTKTTLKRPFHTKLESLKAATFWTVGPSNDRMFDFTGKKENIVINFNSFESFTFRGHALKGKFLENIRKDPHLGFRGMSSHEFRRNASQCMAGLVGRDQMIIYNKDGSINEAATAEKVYQHGQGAVL